MPKFKPKDWGYQLQNADPKIIAKSRHDLVVIDYEQDGHGSFSASQIKLMKAKGAHKLVSYVSIGEAEDYRDYWKKGWATKPPAWLERENPDWDGNYKVRYWHPDWQKTTIERIREVAKAGYDGAYLDIVDAYEYFAPRRSSAAKDMVDFVAKIAAAARAVNPDFLIIPQNGEGLLKSRKYLSVIDGIAKEDLYYGLEGDGIRNASQETAYSRKLLDIARKAGKFVLNVEYLSDKAAISTYLKDVSKTGYVPYIGPRDLDKLRYDASYASKAMKAATGSAAADAILIGSSFDDVLKGAGGSDRLDGRGGDDLILGLGGRDVLQGGNGADTLCGGEGHDWLAGGAGRDVFRFDTRAGSRNVDTIADFSPTEDRIALETAAFGVAPAVFWGWFDPLDATLPPSLFKAGLKAVTGAQRIVYDQASGALYHDPDGSGPAGQVQFAQVDPGTVLSAAHFLTFLL
jgi:cysteinyl-tRNA synthetase